MATCSVCAKCTDNEHKVGSGRLPVDDWSVSEGKE